MNKKLIFIVLVAISYSLVVSPVFAQIFPKLPLINCEGVQCTLQHFIFFIKNIILLLIDAAGLLAIVFITYGGFVIMTAGGSEERLKDGKKIMLSSVIGLAITLGSVLILNVVEKALKGIFGN